ncbi:MAG TPA: type VI secretion system protein TssA [Verrucomicrobiae bacterium]|nr:type VI secretion system protein TssA [Verrucomicrobiae bacterium]
MVSAEELLKPISAEKTCGEDLSYEPAFQELEVLMRGKAETQFSPAEAPDWKALQERCLELWPRSKDLRLATALSLASLKTGGLPAFREGLALIKGLIEQYWDGVYPLLDPSDNNDPTQRVNIIAALASPVGTFGDPMRLLERLREAPLANSAQMGRFGLADILRSETGEAGPDGKAAASPAQIEAAFRDSNPEELQAVYQAAADSASLAAAIDEFLTKTLGSDKAPDLTALPAELKEIQKRMAPYVAGATAPAPEEGNGEAATGGTGAARQAISGDIQSRQDVVRVIGKICEYYARQEPSSPVPYVLKRAQRLAAMDFMQIIDDLSPESVKEIQRITGEKPADGG